MKFSPAIALLGVVSLATVATVTAKDGDHHLRSTSSNTKSDVAIVAEYESESNCHGISAEGDCASTIDDINNQSCVWCKCAAVPPVCVSKDEASALPPGVFDCATATSTSPDSDSDSDSDNNNDEGDDLVYDFGLTDGRIVQLREKVSESGSEDAEFCDASSKSISGYMDLKGSKVSIVLLYCIVFYSILVFSF